MLRIILFLILAAVTVAVAWWASTLQGHLDIAIGDVAFTTSAPIAILGFAVLVFVLLVVLRLLLSLVHTPARLGAWRARRRRAAGDEAVTRTLVAIAAGDRGHAEREAERARRLHGDTPQAMLLAAEAARLAGREAEAAELYRKLANYPSAALLGLRGLFRQAMAREDWVEAAVIARRAEQAHPGAAWLRDERAQLAIRTGDWAQALQLAGPGAPVVAFATGAAERARDPAEATRLARQAFRDNPDFVPAALAYARRLRADDKETRAQEVLRQTWKQSPHPDLAALALAPATDAAARLAEAQRLIAGNPAHPESQFLLAGLAFDAGDLARARQAAEAARAAGMNQRRLWMLIADIEGKDPVESDARRDAQSDALRRAATADPDPTWRCEACGTVHAGWQPACPVCHTAGRITWGVPVRMIAAGP